MVAVSHELHASPELGSGSITTLAHPAGLPSHSGALRATAVGGRLAVLPWSRLLAFDGERLGQEHPHEGGHRMADTFPQTASPTADAPETSILVRFKTSNLTSEKYDEALRKHDAAGIAFPPDGMAYHVCFGSNGDNLRVSEIWDSREQLQTYGKQLMPILADAGIEFSGDPEVIEIHNIVKR